MDSASVSLPGELSFFVIGTPAPKGSTRAFIPKGWNRPVITADNSQTQKLWHNSVAVTALAAARASNWQTTDDAVKVDVVFNLQRPKSLPKKVSHCTKKPDIDKLLRTVLDALTGVLWKDDAQVIAVTMRKEYAITTVGAAIMVSRFSTAAL